jgi:hypothetical protein
MCSGWHASCAISRTTYGAIRLMSYFTNPLTDYSPQLEASGLLPHTVSSQPPSASVFSDDHELELASEFLEIDSESDLDRYVGALFDRAHEDTAIKLDEPIERDLGGIFKKIAKVVLPVAGGALGMFVGGPPGAALGGGLASSVGHALGLELEGLSAEDSEFEVAKQFTNFAGAAIKNAQRTKSANDAAIQAAHLYAPGLMDIQGAPSVDRRVGRSDRSSEPALSPSPNGDETMSNYESGHFGPSGGYERPSQGLSEAEQADLAAELMEVTNEAELEGFLDGLLSKGLGALGKIVGGPTVNALGGVLKDAAKAVLPIAGGALGSLVGPAGTQVGQALGSAVGNLFEAEAEAEEREWEAANVFVKVSLDALNHAADASPHAHPHQIARHAVDAAMRRHAPFVHWRHGHHNGHHGAGMHDRQRRRHMGSWVRHGNTIVVHLV